MSATASGGGNPHGRGRASDWITRFLPGVPAGGAVVDVACGAGRHLRAALAAGHPVVGLDRDPSGLADLVGDRRVEIFDHDLEAPGGLALPILGRRFSGVIVSNYLFRPLFPILRDLVAADGVLIYQTFARGQERHGKPSNPAFLLAPNELLAPELIGGLVVVGFEHGEVEIETGAGGERMVKVVQRVVAVGPDHPWVLAAPRPLGRP